MRAYKARGLECVVTEVDILQQGRRGDMLVGARRRQHLEKIATGFYNGVAASPPCATWSRAVWSNAQGPRPCRMEGHPRGFPWLEGKRRRTVEEHNTLADFAFDAMLTQLKTGPTAYALLEHPEDLGATPKGVPASI